PCSVWSDTVLRPQLDPILTRVRVSSSFSLPLPKSTLFPYTTLFRSTMAVTFIIGNSFRISGSIFSPGTTISAAIASEFAESDGLHQSGLILLGLLLFVLTFFVLTIARLMLLHLEKKAGN